MDPLQITLPQGKIRGRLIRPQVTNQATHDVSVRFFGNIPYAQAPFGAQRFKPAQTPLPWRGVRDAGQFGVAAPQAPAPLDDGDMLEGGEDCLTINVWSPIDRVHATELLPVLVYVPGGGFMRGRASDPMYDPISFVRQGMVCVTFNYRIGIDGFMFFDDARDEQAVCNRGLLDMLAAIQWVQDHIALFGGDAKKITLGGVSAGSGAICNLLGLPELRGKIKRVILQSPSAACQTIDEANIARRAIAHLLDCEATLSELEKQPLPKVVRAVARLHFDYDLRTSLGMNARNFFPLRPVIDAQLLKQTPLQQLQACWKEQGWPVPDMLVGANAQEMNFYLQPSREIERVTEARVQAFVDAVGIREEQTKTLQDQLQQANAGRAPTYGELLSAMQADYFYQAPARQLAALARTAGARAWHYNFAWKSLLLDGRMGAAHAMELPFAFNNTATPRALDFCGPNAPQALADEMHQAWSAFALGQTPKEWLPAGTRTFGA